MKKISKFILLVVSLCVTLTAKDVATITGVTGKAFIQRDSVKIDINIGDKLQEKDNVITNDKAKVQIIFTDETIVTIGKNSDFSIGEYLFEDNQEPVAKFSMLKGAMRTITGKIGKIAPDKFTVTAKTATIGIRGTNFSVVVGENDNTEVYCTYGAISVSVNGTEHRVDQGFFIILLPDGKVEIKEFKPQDLKNMKNKFAKSTAKEGTVNDDSTPDSGAVVDNTVENFDNVIIKDITNSTAEAEQADADIDLDVDLASIISGYTMSDAVYNGTYTTTVNTDASYYTSSGTANLKVDFGEDKIDLELVDFITNGSVKQNANYNSSPSITGVNFTANISTGVEGSMSGTFSGETGNKASGTFKYSEGSDGSASGTFNVTSTQTLK